MEPNRRRATARPEQPTASTNTPSRQEHRSLLPKPSQHDEKPPQKESMPSSSSSSSTISSPIRPKTSLTPVACDICRKKKIKCDGRKPTCSPCANYRRPCKYRMPGQAEGLRRRTLELQKSSQDTQRFLELLKSAPDDVAEDLFRNLRAQGTPTNPLGVAAPSIVQPSNAITGLDIHYPNAFPVLEPLGIADIELRFLGLGVDESKPSKRPPTFLDQSETRTKKSPEDKGGPSGLKLQHDLRLQSADFSRWTSVPIPNSLAACAITFYLANEHPLLAIFDADLFLDDLIADRGQFCSTLFATYGQFDLEAKALSTLLLEESQARWKQTVLEDDDDDDDPSLPTVSAAIFLALTCNHHGRDKDGLEYLDASAELGRRLHLFDRNRSSPPPRSFGDERTRAAASFIAWGVFGWHTLHSIYFRRQHQIREAPILPIPGDESGPPLAKYMGSTFTWISKFWLIVHQVFGDGIAGYSRLALPEAKAAFQKLFSWSDSLPDSVRRSDGCPHHVYVMHIWYHTAILDVSRPFLGTKHEGPVGAYNASMQQLKRVLFLYRQRFEETNSTMLVTPGFLYLLNDIYRHIESPEAHFYFVWSLRGCLAIAAWNPGLSGISKAFLSLGRRLGVFERYGWGENVLGAGEKAAVGSLAEDGEYRSLYPINIGLADASKDEMANMEELANEYQQRGQQRTRDGSSALEEDAKDVWKGDPMDLELTLSEATAPDGSK